jgi:hypothetical protein
LSFGDLLGLLLFLVFIILPALNRRQRQGQVGRPPPGQPRAPGQGAPGRPAAPPASASTRPQADVTFPPGDDDLARRLEEARERVRRAMGAPSSTAAPPSAGAPPSAARPSSLGTPSSSTAPTPPRPTVGGPGDPRTRPYRPLVAADRDDGLLGTPLPAREALAGRPRPPVRAPRATMSARDLRAEAPAVEVERLDVPVVRRFAVSEVLSFDAGSVRDGLVWHQVLGAPRARRRVGGGPFPER